MRLCACQAASWAHLRWVVAAHQPLFEELRQANQSARQQHVGRADIGKGAVPAHEGDLVERRGLGGLVGIFIGGSLLVETVFDIQGFGLLQYQAVIARDVPVIMGTLTIAAFLMLLGNVISDMIVAMVDPRIKFK
jgi:hypothetical protein